MGSIWFRGFTSMNTIQLTSLSTLRPVFSTPAPPPPAPPASDPTKDSIRHCAIQGAKIGAVIGGVGLPVLGMVVINAISGNPFGGDAPAAYVYLAVKGAVLGGLVGGAVGAVVGYVRA